MSYRTVNQTVFRIDAVTGGRALCARPDCWADALTWLSPYCCPECARQVAGWLREGGRQTQPLPAAQQQLREQFDAENQMFREILAAGRARRRAAHAEIHEADQALPDSLDEQDRVVLDRVQSITGATIAEHVAVPRSMVEASEVPVRHPEPVYLTPAELARQLRLARLRTRHASAWEQAMRVAAAVADQQPSEILGAQPGPVAYVDEAFPDRPQDARVVPVGQLDTLWQPVLPSGRLGSNPLPQGLDALLYAVNAVRRDADDPMLTGRWEEAPREPAEAEQQPATGGPVLDDEVVQEPFMPGTAWEVPAAKPRPRPPWWRLLTRLRGIRKARR